MERIVEEVAVTDGEGGRPVEVREDAERHRLAPAAHQDRADEAEHEIEPDRRGEGPRDMRAHAESASAPIDADPPQHDRQREEEAGHQPPAAFVQRREDAQPVTRRRRFERQPRQLPHELDRVPVDRGEHVEPDDLECDEAAYDRGDAEEAEIDRPDLRVADQPEQVGEARHVPCRARRTAACRRDADIGWSANLDLREDVLIFGHGILLPPRANSGSADVLQP